MPVCSLAGPNAQRRVDFFHRVLVQLAPEESIVWLHVAAGQAGEQQLPAVSRAAPQGLRRRDEHGCERRAYQPSDAPVAGLAVLVKPDAALARQAQAQVPSPQRLVSVKLVEDLQRQRRVASCLGVKAVPGQLLLPFHALVATARRGQHFSFHAHDSPPW
ncbi:hypothetical protein ACQ86G_23900 [Roseateles chitinivorans]|uniref:hypothetical protein n=1 Tax=Roseateles chitinivorans TaxID=2917965 RepID=UPI003D66F7F3